VRAWIRRAEGVAFTGFKGGWHPACAMKRGRGISTGEGYEEKEAIDRWFCMFVAFR